MAIPHAPSLGSPRASRKNIPAIASYAPAAATSTIAPSESFELVRALKHFQAAQATEAYARLCVPLLDRFHLSEADLAREFLRYNLEINSESNLTYQLIGTQFALLVNYLPTDSWFSRRLDRYSAFIARFNSIVDLGFGFPFPWFLAVRGENIRSKQFILVDSSQSALDFAAEFIRVARAVAPQRTGSLASTLVRGEIEHPEAWGIDNCEAFVAMDCIEHAIAPQESLRRIAELHQGSSYLISLPVGTPIPQHAIDFDDEQGAVALVKGAGLAVHSHSLLAAHWQHDVIGNPGFQGSTFIEAE